MARQILYRNARARDLLDIFLVSAVSSLLLLRFYLHITGYPQVGGGSLHIAHMLWGGVLMLAALVMSLLFLGQQVKRLVALLGGIGFGIFIDELGKFITRDNNYFFRPTIGIIYAVFVVLYLSFNFLSRTQQLTSREYELNAFAELEEAVALDFDATEKQRVLQFLKDADKDSVIARELALLVEKLELVAPPRPTITQQLMMKLDHSYQHFWRRRSSNNVVKIFFTTETVLFLVAVLFTVYTSFDSVVDIFTGKASYSRFLIIGQLVSTIVAAGLAGYAIARLQNHRRVALEYFRRAVLVNLLLTEFFFFCRAQFGAIPSFVFNLVLIALISFVINQEQRLQLKG